MGQPPNLPRQLKSAQVLTRFGVRLLIMTGFAAFGSIGFSRSFTALLWMSTILCAAIGAFQHEPPFSHHLNHWDEAAAYGALGAIVSAVNQYL